MSEQTPNPDKAWRVEHDEGTGAPIVVSQCRDIAVVENSFGDGETHAILIAEAGNIWQQTGLGPQQLARDRAELLEALQKIEQFGHGRGHGCGYTCADMARAVLSKQRGL